MDNKDQTKKCFCARCFMPIDAEDKVDIEGQNFHRICSMCCICRTIPTSLKMFYGHVFCNECFKTHVLTRFRGETPKMHSNSWWMQWAPGSKPQESSNSDDKDQSRTSENSSMPDEPEKKRFICSRCLHAVDQGEKVEIGGQFFHPECARCYFCHAVPTEKLKIYYGQVFCEQCFNEHVLNRNKDNPDSFFKNCFENWQNNAQFADNMRTFMGGSKDNTPFVFMMQGQQHPPFCRCGTGNEWGGCNEAKKSATPGTVSLADETSTWDLSYENRTEFSDIPESCNAIEELDQSAAEKIEKLTKYLHESDERSLKKWKNFIEFDKLDKISVKKCVEFDKLDQTSVKTVDDVASCGWVNLQGNAASSVCPKCLWQCGPIYVNSELLKREVCCGDVSE